MKRQFLVPALSVLVLLSLGSCGFPLIDSTPATETPVPAVSPTAEETALPPTAELGLAENPLILALPPSANSAEQINAAREIAAQFTERTGYVVVVIAPDTYSEIVDAFEKGNVHIALLDPLSYTLAYQKDLGRARFAVPNNGEIKYGTQILAARKGGFTSYFNAEMGENTANVTDALAQFSDKKPCWSEETSPSGFVIPLGLLNQAQVRTRLAAFVGGQTTVVRSLYVGGICDFGGTYIDARKFPSLEDEMPDLIEQVLVIWQTPRIIPYEVLVFSTNMPQPMRELFANIIPAVMQTDAGKEAFKISYGIEELVPVNDGDFNEFHTLVKESRVDLSLTINE